MEVYNKIIEANDGKHKFKIILRKDNKKVKTIKFGALGYEHFTSNTLNEEKKKLYIDRHKSKENWSDELTKGFYAYNFLWRFRTYNEAKKYIYNFLKNKGYN